MRKFLIFYFLTMDLYYLSPTKKITGDVSAEPTKRRISLADRVMEDGGAARRQDIAGHCG